MRRRDGQISLVAHMQAEELLSQASPRDLLAKVSENRTHSVECFHPRVKKVIFKINTFLSRYRFPKKGSGGGNGTGEDIC